MKFSFTFWRVCRELSPSKQFKQTLWGQLDHAWNQKYQQGYRWYEGRIFRLITTAVLSCLVVASVATSAYAYSSPNVTDGTPLYPVKKTIESVEEKLQTTPQAKAKFYLKQIDRREAERQVMIKKNQQLTNVDESIKETAVKLINIENKLNDTTDARLKAAVDAKLEVRRERLEEREEKLEQTWNHLQQLISSTAS